jgi:hypothetical protein
MAPIPTLDTWVTPARGLGINPALAAQNLAQLDTSGAARRLRRSLLAHGCGCSAPAWPTHRPSHTSSAWAAYRDPAGPAQPQPVSAGPANGALDSRAVATNRLPADCPRVARLQRPGLLRQSSPIHCRLALRRHRCAAGRQEPLITNPLRALGRSSTSAPPTTTSLSTLRAGHRKLKSAPRSPATSRDGMGARKVRAGSGDARTALEWQRGGPRPRRRASRLRARRLHSPPVRASAFFQVMAECLRSPARHCWVCAAMGARSAFMHRGTSISAWSAKRLHRSTNIRATWLNARSAIA